MKFFKDLMNIELYRNLRLFRNLKNAVAMEMLEVMTLGDYVHQFWEGVTRAPKMICLIVNADYDCRRPGNLPANQVQWNIFIHLTLKIINLGNEASDLNGVYLDLKGISEAIAPQVFRNETLAFNYVGGSQFNAKTNCPPQSDQTISLSFTVPCKDEWSQPLKAKLKLKFENYRDQVVKKKVSKGKNT